MFGKIALRTLLPAAALTMTLGAAVAPACAQPGQNGYYLYEYTYYSDAAQTEVVGTYSERCDGYATGTYDQTPWYTRERVGYFNYRTGRCTMY